MLSLTLFLLIRWQCCSQQSRYPRQHFQHRLVSQPPAETAAVTAAAAAGGLPAGPAAASSRLPRTTPATATSTATATGSPAATATASSASGPGRHLTGLWTTAAATAATAAITRYCLTLEGCFSPSESQHLHSENLPWWASQHIMIDHNLFLSYEIPLFFTNIL